MDKYFKWIGDAAPFFAPYPAFVKLLFIAWLFIGVALVASLILAAPSREDKGGLQTAEGLRDIWLVIEGMEFFSAKPGAQVRVTANVNGTEFTYPSVGAVEWLEVGPGMSSQSFHLPPARDKIIVRFQADVRVPSDDQDWISGQLISVNEKIINVDDPLPISDKYVLHTFDPVHNARGANAAATLSYKVTSDP